MVPELHSTSPSTDPTILFEIAEGMHAIEALTASIGWLRLFEWVHENPATECQICEALAIAARPAHVLLTLLLSFGLLTRNGKGVYSLTVLAREHLLSSSPWSLVPCFEALKDRPPCIEMLNVLRTGKPFGVPEQDSNGPRWAEAMSEEAFAEYFLNAIDSRNAYLANAMAKQLNLDGFRRLLDIGGGSGIYSCALVSENAALEATVLEKPPVDQIARRAVERRGLSDRVTVKVGDMLDSALPGGYGIHLYSNVIHDWPEAAIAQFLRSSFEALPPCGLLVIHDALLDESGAGPRAVAEYSVLLMAFTAGRCYSVSELRSIVEACGFMGVTHRPTVAHRSIITASKPDETRTVHAETAATRKRVTT